MKNLYLSVVTLVIAIVLTLSAWSNHNVRVARMFSGEGLENSTYTSFCMDARGFMWIGTDNGLIRSDGNHFIHYRHNEKDSCSISDNRILGIIRDRNDRVWIATANGLNLFEESKDTFRKIYVPDFGEKGYIVSLTADHTGKITFVVAGVGIYEISVEENGVISVRRLDTNPVLKNVNCILEHIDGRLYAGTSKGTVYELKNGRTWEKVTQLNTAVFDMSQESNGSIIINTFSGLYRFDPKSRNLTHILLEEDIMVNNLSAHDGDHIYIATYGAGVWKICIDSDTAEYCDDIFSPFVDMKDSRIGTVYGAGDGSLWIGCDFFGVLRVPFNENSFIYRKLSDIIKDFDVPLISMNIWNGNIIIGNSLGMIAVMTEDGKILNKTIIAEGKAITSIDVINNQKAILGIVDSGVWEYDLLTGGKRKIVDISEKYLSIEACLASDGCIYIGLYAAGLLKYDPKTGKKMWISHDSDSIDRISPYITTIKSYDDKLWIGSYGGLACYNISKGSFEKIDQTPYMTCAVFDIVPDSSHSVFIATSNGLIRYDINTKETSKYTTLNGLSDNDVRSIAIDGKGGKWIGTMRGINYQAPDDDFFISYSGGHGIVERTFENLKYSEDIDRILAAGRIGLTSFNPDSKFLPQFIGPLEVSAIYLKGKKTNLSELSNSSEIILPYDENSIAFRISTMDFRDTSNLRYLWKFSGDKDWVELPDGSDIINLSSLSPGRYSLEFKAEEAGVESPVSVIKIMVTPPWYLTWQANFFYLLLLGLLVVLAVVVIRKRGIERINERKMQFFIDMSHDMRSPLTLIIGPLESLLKEQLREDLRERIRGIYRNAHRILYTINQLLDLKRMDYGKKSLKCLKTKVPEFISEIVDMFQPQAKDHGVDLTFYSAGYWDELWIDRSVIDRILVNLISNAIKYTPADGKIEVLLDKSNDNHIGECIKISVIDNGIGIEAGFTTDIFSRYFRLENGIANSEDGFGIGLDICRRYIRLHHGVIYCENRKDGTSGCVFSILIPTDKNKYGSDELIYDESGSGKMSGNVFNKAKDCDTTIKRVNIPGNFRLLIVEDDVDLLDSLCDYFKGIGYEVLSATDGVEGYQVARQSKPDIIMTDVKMPHEDGLQLLQRLKDNPDTQHIPIVILSSKNELNDRVAGWKMGAEGYIAKPFDFNELKAIVNNLIEGRKKFISNSSAITHNVKGNDEILLEKVNKILEERIDDEYMNVDRLAQEVGVSRTHLYRRLKERLGMNPSEYIRNRRLQRACELLRNDDLDVTQIAYVLGFSSQSQFSTTFKRYMGCTPTEYRMRHT